MKPQERKYLKPMPLSKEQRQALRNYDYGAMGVCLGTYARGVTILPIK